MVSPPQSTTEVFQQLPSNSSKVTQPETPASSTTMWAAFEPTAQEELSLDDMIWTGLGPNAFLDFDTFLNTDTQDWMDVSTNIVNPQLEEEVTVNDASLPSSTSSLSPTVVRTQQFDKYLPGESASFEVWHGSPIQLLNSMTLAHQATKALCQVYDTMMTGVARRYLSYNCNQFAGSHRYVFEPECCADQITTSDEKGFRGLADIQSALSQYTQRPWEQSGTQMYEKGSEPFRPITLIGVARFLDNFGALYGNRLDRRKRKQDEETFMSVLQAFALQFEPADDLGDDTLIVKALDASDPGHCPARSQLFTAAWFNAHSYLTESMKTRSFVHLYSVSLFHTIAMPNEARTKPEYSGGPLAFLDQALSQLHGLSRLVEVFCSNLGSDSRYRTLLDSSRRVLFWFAYVRDTMASVLCDRQCKLKDGPISGAGSWS